MATEEQDRKAQALVDAIENGVKDLTDKLERLQADHTLVDNVYFTEGIENDAFTLTSVDSILEDAESDRQRSEGD